MSKLFTPKPGEQSSEPSSQTIIGESVKLEGTFTSSGPITVYGEVVGTLKTENDLTIQESAVIEANVEAMNITVAGSIQGNIICHGQLTLLQSGKIFGDISAKVISIETGAIFQGKCSTGTEQKTAIVDSMTSSSVADESTIND